MILADKIILLRKKNGWSQEELAEQLNVSRQSVSKWESGASIPDLEKIVKMSGLFGVSTDFLLKDELEEIAFSEEPESGEEEGVRSVSLEEANTFMSLTAKLSPKIALATMLCVMSPICLIAFDGLAEYAFVMTEDMAGGLGVAILLMLVAVGVSIFITTGMQLSKYEYLEHEQISLQYGVQGIVEKKKEDFAPAYRKCIVFGVTLCILGVVPLMLAEGFGAGDLVCVFCVDILLFMIAIAVYFFVWSGNIQGSYDKLLQKEDYSKEKKENRKKTGAFIGVYWCVATAIYLGISFANNSWDTSWIVWPVAGVLFAAYCGILDIVMKGKSGK